MTPDDYALSFSFDLQAYDLLSARSMQDDDGQIGASNFGCREQMRRILAKEPRTDSPDKTAAIIGTYIDAGVKQARKAANPALIIDAELPVTLYPHEQPDGFTFLVHPDEIDPDEPSCTDVKSKNGLAAIRRGFADPQYRMQRHLQVLAAVQNGVLPDTAIARNVYLDRSGVDGTPHVEQEPFSPAVIVEATEFLNDALYANLHGEEAPKDKPRTWCRDYCPFNAACRGPEIEVELITDERVAAMVRAYGQADTQEKTAGQLRKELREAGLAGLSGRTADGWVITSTWVNAKNPYYRVAVEAPAVVPS